MDVGAVIAESRQSFVYERYFDKGELDAIEGIAPCLPPVVREPEHVMWVSRYISGYARGRRLMCAPHLEGKVADSYELDVILGLCDALSEQRPQRDSVAYREIYYLLTPVLPDVPATDQ